MRTRLGPKTALAALAAVGLFLPFGAPLPGSCIRAVGVAGAAPSPSCGGDLRECLRASADMHTTTFGGRYVTADDVARCMEAFRSCTSGGAGRGGNQSPSTSTSPRGNSADTGIPQRFTITDDQGGQYDCRLNGDTVDCTTNYEQPNPFGTYTDKGKVTGTLSGSTMTGTYDSRSTTDGRDCTDMAGRHSGPVTFIFNTDGTVTMRGGPMKHEFEPCGNAPASSRTTPEWEATGEWLPSG